MITYVCNEVHGVEPEVLESIAIGGQYDLVVPSTWTSSVLKCLLVAHVPPKGNALQHPTASS